MNTQALLQVNQNGGTGVHRNSVILVDRHKRLIVSCFAVVSYPALSAPHNLGCFVYELVTVYVDVHNTIIANAV